MINRRDFLKFCGLSLLVAPILTPSISDSMEIPVGKITETAKALPFLSPLLYATPGDLVMLSGGPNSGKSKILTAYSNSITKNGKRVLFISADNGDTLPNMEAMQSYDCIIIDNIDRISYPKDYSFRSRFLSRYIPNLKNYLSNTGKVGIISVQTSRLYEQPEVKRGSMQFLSGGISLQYVSDRIYYVNNNSKMEIIKDRRV